MSVADAYGVRPPRLEDADELGSLHVGIWREAYAGLIADEVLADLDPLQRADRWRTIISSPTGRLDGKEGSRALNVVAVHHDTGALVGFASAGPCRDDPPRTERELWALYLLREHRGSGVADLLLAAVLPPGPATLWVLAGNDRAIGYYRKQGFELDGAREHDERHGSDDLRMVR